MQHICYSFGGACSVIVVSYFGDSPNPSVRRNGDDGCPLIATGFSQGKKQHDESEHALGIQIAVVNPEPHVSVTHRRVGIGRTLGIAVDSDQIRKSGVGALGAA